MTIRTWAASAIFGILLLQAEAQLPNPEYYTLFYSTSNTTQLIDSNGTTLHTWPNTLTALSGTTAYLREDGLLLRSGQNGANPGGFLAGSYSSLQLVTWEGQVVWQFDLQAQGEVTLHHDMKNLSNGNILSTVWDFVPAAELVNLGWSPTGASGLWLERIIEIEPNLSDGTSQIVWSWELRDHLVQDIDSSLPNFGTVSANPGKVDINFFTSPSTDPFHISGIEYNPVRDEIILCPNVTDEIWIIDHSTTTAEAATSSGGARGQGGDLIYRWGNPTVYDSAGPNAQKFLERAHDPRLLLCSPEEGCTLTIHNNVRIDDNLNSLDSQVLRIDLPIDASGNYVQTPGEAFGPTAPEVLYENDPSNPFFNTPFMGGAQVLSNGHILITLPLTPRFVEVDQEGNVVWDFTVPGRGFIFKGQNYPINYAGYGPSLPFNYEVWREANFGTAATNSSPSEDPDDDGNSNLAEYYIGSNPLASNNPPLLPVAVERDGTNTLFRTNYTQRRNLVDIQAQLEFSRSLDPWFDESDTIPHSESQLTQSSALEEITFEATLDATHPRGFFRLNIDLTE